MNFILIQYTAYVVWCGSRDTTDSSTRDGRMYVAVGDDMSVVYWKS